MALKARKKKTSRIGKVAQNLADRKHFGDEPMFPVGTVLTTGQVIQALNWYSYMCDVTDAKEFLPALKHVKDDLFPLTAAWLQRLEDNGAVLPAGDASFKDRKIAEFQDRIEGTPKKEPLVDRSIQDRVRERVRDHIAEFEAAIDKRDPEFSAYTYLQSQNVPVMLAKQIADHYAPLMIEFIETATNSDPQLTEAYKCHGKKGFRALFDYVNNICKDLERYINGSKAAKAPRKPRKKKAADPSKLVKSVKFKLEDDSLKVKSINPLAIVGAQELWTLNTKTRTLAVYRADGPSGLSVKGTTLTGFDEKTSSQKRVGRVMDAAISKVLSAGKVQRRKLLDEFKSDASVPTGRLNADTLLLRV